MMMRSPLAASLAGSFAVSPLAAGVPARAGSAVRYGDAGAAGGRNGDRGPGPGASAPPAAGSHRQWSSDQLFGDRQEIEIVHGESVYRLRVTSLGKLILTK